jgi:hypothetical protein
MIETKKGYELIESFSEATIRNLTNGKRQRIYPLFIIHTGNYEILRPILEIGRASDVGSIWIKDT